MRGIAGVNQLYYNTTTNEISYLPSTRSTKTEITTFTEDTSMLFDVAPQTYIYQTDPNAGRQIGYIADEVPTVLAIHDKDGIPININWNAMTVFVIEELRKVRTELAELKKIVTSAT